MEVSVTTLPIITISDAHTTSVQLLKNLLLTTHQHGM